MLNHFLRTINSPRILSFLFTQGANLGQAVSYAPSLSVGSAPIGTQRRFIYLVIGAGQTSGAWSWTTVNCGGVAMTELVQANDIGQKASIYVCEFTNSNTTATFNLTKSALGPYTGVAVYSVITNGAATKTFSTATDADVPVSLALNTPSRGYVLTLQQNRNYGFPTISNATSNYQVDLVSNDCFVSASAGPFTSQTTNYTITYSYTLAGSDVCSAAVSIFV